MNVEKKEQLSIEDFKLKEQRKFNLSALSPSNLDSMALKQFKSKMKESNLHPLSFRSDKKSVRERVAKATIFS